MKELEFLLEAYQKTVFEKDVAGFIALYDEQVQIFDLWEKWSYNGLTEWSEMVNDWFSSLETNRDQVTFDHVKIELNGEMAFITAIVKFTNVTATGEELRYLENRLTWICKKKEASWKIIHQHTSSPINSTTMQVLLQQ